MDTGTVTCTGTTQTGTIGTLYGVIKKIEVTASASSDVHIFVDASDIDNGNIVDENVLGTSGGKITVNTTLIVYPVMTQYTGSNNTITDPDQYTEMIVGGRLEYSLANVAADDTFRIVVYYEPITGN